MVMQRFRIAEQSMLPALSPGEEIVASASISPKPGNIVTFPHPSRPDFWLVKRVVEKDGLANGQIWVESDNRSVSSSDSREFGPVPSETVLTRVARLDGTTFVEAVELLAEEDQSLARIVGQYGIPDFWKRPEGFATLVLLIMEQQVSLESGAATFARLVRLWGEVTPGEVAATDEAAMRSVGVTRQKASYVAGLAELVLNGELDLHQVGRLSPSQAREVLTSIRGIGPWTADAYLLSALGFPDIFPIGDRALQVGAMEAVGLTSVPSGDELGLLSETWRPIRAVAARLIWHAYLAKRGRREPPFPT